MPGEVFGGFPERVPREILEGAYSGIQKEIDPGRIPDGVPNFLNSLKIYYDYCKKHNCVLKTKVTSGKRSSKIEPQIQ